jgi:phosphate transport system permease protein
VAALSAARLEVYADLRRRPFKHLTERAIVGVLYACGTVSLLTTVAIVYVLFEETLAFFQEVSLRDFFLSTEWQPLFRPISYGVWELVAGTANVVFWSVLFALPIGLASAIYLSEYAHPRTRRVLKPIIEALAGVPTVVYAYFALQVITQDILRPLFGEDLSFFNSLSASLMLADDPAHDHVDIGGRDG